MSKHFVLLIVAMFAGLGLVPAVSPAQTVEQTHSANSGPSSRANRLIVLTDIEADPDDTETMVRLMLYSAL